MLDIGIVLDTNFLIDHLDWLENLLKLIQQDTNINIYVPYIVIQELDSLKLKKIVQVLYNSDIIILKEITSSTIIRNNDDFILENVLALDKSIKVLLSNDYNLCVKASVYSVKTVSRPLLDPLQFYLQLKGLLKDSRIKLGKIEVIQDMEIDTEQGILKI
jgi:rRNA-processing protein FCF1